MRIAGGQLSDGGIVWLDAGDYNLAPLDGVHFRANGTLMHADIIVTPNQLLRPPTRVDGTIADLLPREQPDVDCDDLPGADLPPLGTEWAENGVTGLIVGLDPVGGTVTVRQDDGATVITVPFTGSEGTARAPRA